MKLEENKVITTKLGRKANQIYIENGIIYTKLSPLMRFLGYSEGGGGRVYAEKLGLENSKKIKTGKTESWFINKTAFDKLLETTTIDIEYSDISTVYRDVFKIDMSELNKGKPYSYMFFENEILEIIKEVNSKPVNKSKVIDLLLRGKR